MSRFVRGFLLCFSLTGFSPQVCLAAARWRPQPTAEQTAHLHRAAPRTAGAAGNILFSSERMFLPTGPHQGPRKPWLPLMPVPILSWTREWSDHKWLSLSHLRHPRLQRGRPPRARGRGNAQARAELCRQGRRQGQLPPTEGHRREHGAVVLLCRSDRSLQVKSESWEPSPCLGSLVHGSWMMEIFQGASSEFWVSSEGPKGEVGWAEAT